MTNFAFYSSFAFTLFSAICFFLLARRRVKAKFASSTVFTAGTLFSGLVCGGLVFPGLVELFRQFGATVSYGHGEVLIAALIFNFAFACLLVILGRIALNGKPINW
jgi:hypothetical protein